MNYKAFLIFISFYLFFFCISCKRTNDIVGPEACPSKNFVVVSPLVFKDYGSGNTTELNLMTSYASIKASFNEVISYKLVISGSSSNAEFVAFGNSNEVAINWYGNSTNGKYFQKDEMLSYELLNICKREPLGSGKIKLITIIGYTGFGVKVINFEDSPAVSTSQYGFTTTPMIVTPATSGYIASPQGENYKHYEATSALPSWYFGGEGFNGINFSALGNDPSKIYLNFFAKGTDNTQCQMIIKETVRGTSLNRKFLANVSAGWALYSVKLSDIGIINPSLITNLDLNLAAALTPDTNVSLDVDLLIFTFDKPF